MIKRIRIFILSMATLVVTAVLFNGCYKESPLPDNPYDKVKYTTVPPPADTLSPSSFTGLHRNIFAVKCANPGCHDGNFEPDFRTVQSSYSTLVYQAVKKNNDAKEFTYRVVPYDTALSVLHERITNCCFVNQDDRMPQDNIGVPLPDKDINNIAKWILDGARDMFGQPAKFPNKEPQVVNYLALTSLVPPIMIISHTNNRIDSVFYNPFKMEKNSDMVMAVQVTDDSTAVKDMKVNKLRMSYDPDNFTPTAPGYKEYTCTYFKAGKDEFWITNVNTSDFQPGKVVYMRYFVNDGSRVKDTEFPETGSLGPYKTYWSFYVKP